LISKMKEEELDRVVVNYLKRKGYTQAQKQLETEATQLSLQALTQKLQVTGNTSISNSILFHNPLETVNDYETSYSSIREWIYSSVAMYRSELVGALYPVLIHIYLSLIRNSLPDEATLFLSKYKKEHEEFHDAEIKAIISIKTPEQLEQSEIAQKFLQTKYPVRLCTNSFDLLIAYLMEHKFMLILAIINQHVDIRVFVGIPNEQAEQEYKAITSMSDDEVNSIPIQWGLLHELIPNEQTDPNAMDVSEPSPKKQKLFAEVETIQSRVPLPPPNELALLQRFEDLRKAVTINSTHLPSICCYTFLNTNNSLNTLEISHNSSVVAAGFSDSLIRVWDLEKSHTRMFGTVVQQKASDSGDPKEKRGDQSYTTLYGHSGPVYSLSFSPDNQYMLSSSEDSTIRLWNLESKMNLVCYKGHNYPVWDVDFSPVGYYFASCSHDRTARLWATDHVFPLRLFAGHTQDVDCVKFHPNCNYIATGSTDKSVRLWDVQTGECVRIFTGHSGPIYSLAFSPDGKSLASAGDDKLIHIWDLGSSKKLYTLTGHQSTIWSLSYSQEGSVLASGSADLTVKLWSMEKHTQKPVTSTKHKNGNADCSELLKSFPTKKTPIQKVQFSTRNLLIAAGVFSSRYK